MRGVILIIGLLALMHPSFSQSNAADYVPGTTVVKIDATTLDMPDLPFDNPAVLVISNIKLTTITYALVMIVEGTSFSKDDSVRLSGIKAPIPWVKYGDTFNTIILYDQVWNKNKKRFYRNTEYFKPIRTYVIRIVFLDKNKKYLAAIERSNHIRVKFGDYMKADFGFAIVPNIKGVIGTASAHIHLAPINYDADLGKLKGLGKQVSQRFSFFFGISPLMIKSETKQPISKLTNTGNFIYGIGIRSPFYGYYGQHRVARAILQPMRLNFGNIVFTQANASPLITTPVTKQEWYIGISYDLTLSSLFGPISKLAAL